MSKENISLTKIEDAVKHLSEVDPSYEDSFELLGVLVDDIADMYKASDKAEFAKQKADAKLTLKHIRKQIKSLSFESLKSNVSLTK